MQDTLQTTSNPPAIKRDSGELKKWDTYLKFIDFFSLPYGERPEDMRTQQDFARKYEVTPETLSIWKRRPDFQQAVGKKRRDWGLSRTSDVLAALTYRCLKHGQAKDVELFLRYFDGWDPKKVESEEDRGPIVQIEDYQLHINELPPERRKRLNEMFIALTMAILDEVRLQERREEAALSNDPYAPKI